MGPKGGTFADARGEGREREGESSSASSCRSASSSSGRLMVRAPADMRMQIPIYMYLVDPTKPQSIVFDVIRDQQGNHDHTYSPSVGEFSPPRPPLEGFPPPRASLLSYRSSFLVLLGARLGVGVVRFRVINSPRPLFCDISVRVCSSVSRDGAPGPSRGGTESPQRRVPSLFGLLLLLFLFLFLFLFSPRSSLPSPTTRPLPFPFPHAHAPRDDDSSPRDLALPPHLPLFPFPSSPSSSSSSSYLVTPISG